MDDAGEEGRLILQPLYEKKISYAQNQEDILLDRVLDRAVGFYVDIGANDPVFHSVTKRLYDKGWSGINVEPNPVLYKRLCKARPRDININAGVSSSAGTLTFHEVDVLHGWSTFEPNLAAHYRRLGHKVFEQPISVRTLASILEEHVRQPIDFLKIDVEGFERQVLETSELARWQPRIVVIEAAWPETWESLVFASGYEYATFDGLNRYYVRSGDAVLANALRVPVNVTDNWILADYLKLFERVGVMPADLGPNTIELICRMKAFARKHPKLSAMAKRVLRLAG